MAFTFTDRNTKTILHSWGRFRARVTEAVVTGDLLALLGTEASDALQLANATDATQHAMAVACECGAADETIWCCLAAEVKAPASVGAGGTVTQQYFGAVADYVGSAIYLSDTDGKVSHTAGTKSQQVGFYIARDRLMLVPMHMLAGTTFAFSGNGTIGGTLGVTGVATFGVGPIFSAGFIVPTGQDVELTKGDVIVTEGNVTLTTGVINMVQKTSKTATATLLDTEQGYVEVSPVAETTLTLPTAAAGKYFLIKHLATAQTLIVKAGTDDKLIDPSDGGVHDKATDDKGLDTILELRAVDAVNWLVIHHDGDWTFAD